MDEIEELIVRLAEARTNANCPCSVYSHRTANNGTNADVNYADLRQC